MILIGSGDVVNKRARQLGVPIGSYLIVQSISYSVIVLMLAIIYGGIKWTNTDVIYSLLSAVFGFISVSLMLHSLTHGDAGVNYTIFRSSFVLSTAVAILLLHERISSYKILGIALACLAIFLFFYRNGRSGAKKRSLTVAIAAMVTAAGFQIIMKLSTNVFSSTLSFVLLMNLFFAIFVILYNLLFGTFRFPKQTFTLAPLNGVLMAMATLCYVTALKSGELSTSVPIIQLSFIITAMLSAKFLHEKFSMSKMIGILCAAVAIAVLGFLGGR
ncbi:MAG: DMT family transporter [candidate division WOR-3 bacterium]|nr:MAG: DMT family transporter [candidate division WOR-3 bacterium]